MGYGYQPAHKKQLDGSPTESVDCGVIATAVAIDWLTKGVKAPGRGTVRDRMNKPSGGTTAWDWERAIESYDTPGELEHKFTELRARRETEGGPDASWDDVKAWLWDKKTVILGVHYGKYRKAAPGKTGSESFDGWHGLFLSAIRDNGNQVEIRVYDSLCDGRYDGCCSGPQWVANNKLKDAALSYGKAVSGKANVIAGCFLPFAEEIDNGEPPEPEPPDPCENTTMPATAATEDTPVEAGLLLRPEGEG